MAQETLVKSLFEGFKISHLPGHAHGEFNHDVLTKAKETEAIVTNLADPLAKYEAAVQKETQASYKELTDSITKRINEMLVPARNEVETGLKSAFRALMESDDQQVAKAASQLFELTHLHHLHTDMRMNEQTDAIRDFISDVETNHMEALELTGYVTLFNKLKAANEAVCDAVMERMEIDAERVTGVMAEARKDTDEAYRGLLHGVDAYAYVQGAEGYKPFAAFVNQLIKYYKSLYPSTAYGSSEGSGAGTEDNPDEGGENQQPEGGENNENQQPGGEQGGGTNTPSGPNTDAWGDGDEGDGSDV